MRPSHPLQHPPCSYLIGFIVDNEPQAVPEHERIPVETDNSTLLGIPVEVLRDVFLVARRELVDAARKCFGPDEFH